MRICFIGDASGYHVRRWISYFGKMGYQTHCISTGDAEIPGVTVHHIRNRRTAFGFRHMFYPIYYFAVKRLLDHIRPDVVHGLQINYYSYMAMHAGCKPFVITPFGGDVLVKPKKSPISKNIAEYCLSRADLITTDAEHIQETLVRLGADARKIRLIYFATDVAHYRPQGKDEGLVDVLGLRGCTCVISMRHLMPIYNIETLIRSIPMVAAKCQSVKYLIFSHGPDEEMLKALAKSLRVSEKILWLGFLSGEQLPKYINLGDIYVSTSLSDAGLAASTGEAMACGLPAIITDFGDNAQWVRNEINGFLFPMKDYKALAESILRLAGNPELRARMGAQNRKIIEERYNWEKEMGKMESLYRQLVGEHGEKSNGR